MKALIILTVLSLVSSLFYEVKSNEATSLRNENIAKEEGNCQKETFFQTVKVPGCESKMIVNKRCSGKCKIGTWNFIAMCTECKPISVCYMETKVKCLYGKIRKVLVPRHRGCVCMPTPCNRNTSMNDIDQSIMLKSTGSLATMTRKCFERTWFG